jgi:hypothetical protein
MSLMGLSGNVCAETGATIRADITNEIKKKYFFKN